jgi:hypothetical protein
LTERFLQVMMTFRFMYMIQKTPENKQKNDYKFYNY